ALEGVRSEPVWRESTIAKFDLSLSMALGPDGFYGAVEYNTDLFDSDRIKRMIGHFRTLLQAVAVDPDARLSGLPLLTQSEKRLLEGWNDTSAAYPQHKAVFELVEEQAARAPNAVAVIDGTRRLTYGELN